jgi:hypothetical protein
VEDGGVAGRGQHAVGGFEQVEQFGAGEAVVDLAALVAPDDKAAVLQAGDVGRDGGLGQAPWSARRRTIASRVGSDREWNSAAAGGSPALISSVRQIPRSSFIVI